ncbi:WxL domain-containing protein [Vagococcus sp. PNs007]|uniref:WxL domain-containing protein n=1 Tax=Vagococcus proximus TaxID=2991417 RepID=A0ABT5X0Y5_9ENTE|nr:WxL domain-containing protein [Vagococcus proximus]MDF0479569.1 WxL domain-containing protein [Vagococcus proximus]
MKKTIKVLLVSGIALGGSSIGLVANAVSVKDDQAGKTVGHVTFEKGELSFVNKDAANKELVVPTFDFEPGQVGSESIAKLKDNSNESDNHNNAVRDTVGVVDYTGEELGWTVSVQAEQFIAPHKTTEPEETTRAVKDALEIMSIDFSIKAKDVTGRDGELSSDKFGMTDIQLVTVDAKKNSEPTAIFTAPKGEESAGKFLFDYSKTKLRIPQATAATAKSTTEYKSDLTWKLSQGTNNSGQEAAVPVK